MPPLEPVRSPLVVGAAVVDCLSAPRTVLGARRTRPPEVAGRWELPGGKVEAGESPQQALHRELREELGVEVELGAQVCGPGNERGAVGGWPIGRHGTLLVWLARVRDGGIPAILEDHDQLRELSADDLASVAWLPADRPVVRAIGRHMWEHVATLRPATVADLDPLLAVQQSGAEAGLGHLFPQAEHPFPRAALRDRWAAELADPGTDVFVLDTPWGLRGFAAARGAEVLHVGTHPRTWGSGLAGLLLDQLITRMPAVELHLWVFEGNDRARRFYRRSGWVADGERRHSSFPPHPVLVRWVRPVGATART